jgi:tetratricopeptide (TPR) repeat protein
MTLPAADTVELRTATGIDRLQAIGRSWRGVTYRSLGQRACYRLLSEQEASLELRTTVESWIGRPRRQGIAPVVEAAQVEGQGRFYVRYEVAAIRPLADALADPDVGLRLTYAAAAVRALLLWWRELGQGVMPTSSDIFFDGGTPYLLPLPAMPFPRIDAALADSGLASGTAPELMRGTAAPSADALDRYALGALLLRVFLRPAADDPGEVLLRAANGTLFDAARLESALPFWLAGTDAARSAQEAARSLVNPDPRARVTVDLAALAAQFDRFATRMEPVTLAAELRAAGKTDEALNLLTDVLLDKTTYELLMAHGETALDLGRALEALDSFERAVLKRPDRPEAYEGQLRAIGRAEADRSSQGRSQAGGERRGAPATLDMILWRNFHKLTVDRQEAHEDTVARYLLNRGKHEPAASFIYPRLFRGGEFLGGKLLMNIAYCEALAGLGDVAGALKHIAHVKDQVVDARLSGTIPDEEARQHKLRLSDLESRLAARRSQPGPPRPGGSGWAS